jgi:hypothetical protein
MLRTRGSSLRDPTIKQGKLNKAGRELSAAMVGLCRKNAVSAAGNSLTVNYTSCCFSTSSGGGGDGGGGGISFSLYYFKMLKL